MFRNRQDAGQRLAGALCSYGAKDLLVLAIPRGGVEVGYHIATRLDAEFGVLVVRKLPLPRNPEAGFGAIAEDGSTFLIEHMVAALRPKVIEQVLQVQEEEVRRRVKVFREGEPLPEIAGRTVILVDDGIATGSTIRAGIAMCRNKHAKNIVVAAPVASPSTTDELAKSADEVVVIEKPRLFRAVAQVYQDWYDVPDEEVLSITREFMQQRA
jgi:putative phosphoribosyl transferase